MRNDLPVPDWLARVRIMGNLSMLWCRNWESMAVTHAAAERDVAKLNASSRPSRGKSEKIFSSAWSTAWRGAR